MSISDKAPERSHQEIFSEVFDHAQAIVRLTMVTPMACRPEGKDEHGTRFYFVVAYRWGNFNAHWYFVYVGGDQVKAVALANEECHGRGGKYGCAVYEFDGNGIDYSLIYYTPSMMETAEAKAPSHNYRVDYFEHLGMLLDSAYDGQVLLPDQEHEGQLRSVEVELPAWLKVEVERQRERMASLQVAIHKEAVPAHDP